MQVFENWEFIAWEWAFYWKWRETKKYNFVAELEAAIPYAPAGFWRILDEMAQKFNGELGKQ